MMKINESLAWSIMEATEFESMTSIKLMSEFQKKYEKREVFFTSAGKAQKMDITEPQKKDSKYKDYAELTRMVRGMTLLIKEKETRNADKSYLLCFNCDGRGHKTRECSRPRNEELYKKLSSEYFNSRKEKPEANKTLMLTEVEEGEQDKTLAAENKRMLLDQINNEYELAEHSGNISRANILLCRLWVNVLCNLFEKIKANEQAERILDSDDSSDEATSSSESDTEESSGDENVFL
ncbi:hypothetical protein AYI69_g8528 [Smittium culicis]|uniref:CCHC-type domain-containing protein n=1 Tax=Smittium culicis TaxID=133412 RepID=A0A1R1XJ08_9FUNG|nr:hypothetical protein AYI69_g8528 [Smittium culicis]